MKKRIIPRALALFMALSLLSTTAFAASFADLQNAINGTGDTDENMTADGYYGYAQREDQSYGITAKTNEDGSREVNLHDKVTHAGVGAAGEPDYIKVEGMNLTLNMNGNTIDGGNRVNPDSPWTVKRTGSRALIGGCEESNIIINGGANAEDTTKRGTLTGGYNSGLFFNGGNNTAVINYVDFTGNYNAGLGWLVVDDGGAIDVGCNNQIELNYVKLTGNYAKRHSGAIALDPGATAYINNCVISDNHAQKAAGAIGHNGATSTIVNSRIENNTAGLNGGGVEGRGTIYLKGTTVITNNTAQQGGGICLTAWSDEGFGATLLIDADVVVCNNTETGMEENWDIRVYAEDEGAEINYSGEHVLHGWTGAICTEPGTCSNCGETMDHPLGHDMGEWVVTTPAQPGVPGEETRVCSRGDHVETRPIPALPVDPGVNTGVPGDTGMIVDFAAGGGAAATTIEDDEIPLADIFTRADAIGYLWEQSGSPEWELSDFEDVPEDHEWAVAIGWAEDMGIALPDEDGNFRPDDLVLRSSDEPEGEFQEFLNRYAVYAGIELEDGELFIELEGLPIDFITRDEAEDIFDMFFAKLESALEAKAA